MATYGVSWPQSRRARAWCSCSRNPKGLSALATTASSNARIASIHWRFSCCASASAGTLPLPPRACRVQPRQLIDRVRACHSAYVFVLLTWHSYHENLKGKKTPPVVTMFHNLYDNVTRDVFVTRLNWLGLPIELPVFSGEREALPDELVQFLLRGKTIERRKTEYLGGKVCRAADSPGCYKAGSCCCRLACSAAFQLQQQLRRTRFDVFLTVSLARPVSSHAAARIQAPRKAAALLELPRVSNVDRHLEMSLMCQCQHTVACAHNMCRSRLPAGSTR